MTTTRVALLAVSLVALATFIGVAVAGPATTAQGDDPDATIAAYQTEVSGLSTKVAQLRRSNEKLRTQVSDLTTQVAEHGPTPTPTAGDAAGSQIGLVVRGVGMDVLVTGIERLPAIETSSETSTARGVYLTVSFTLTNTGSAPVELIQDTLVVADGKGRTFAYTPHANTLTHLNADRLDDFVMHLQPGLPFDSFAIFDIPPDATGLVFTDEAGDFAVRLDG